MQWKKIRTNLTFDKTKLSGKYSLCSLQYNSAVYAPVYNGTIQFNQQVNFR